jgi:ferrochelatase
MVNKPGVLIVNLGSPDQPTAKSVRKYLFQFLHDKRVIDTSRWIWCWILHGIILRVRPAKSARAYKKVWGDLGNDAPLVAITRLQAKGIEEQIKNFAEIEVAMRYGNPSIDGALKKLEEKGCSQIGVLPMYPQFAGATTASVYDGVAKALIKRKNVPELRFVRHYYDDERFIKILAGSLKKHLKSLPWKPDVIITSYHGLPQSYVEKGDPYQKECIQTTELLKKEMGNLGNKIMTTFQSRFGPKAWLKPYTDKTLEKLAENGTKNIVVMMPGFSADCLETLEEISIEAREVFIEAGGVNFSTVPCLNDDKHHTNFLTNLIKERLLVGWL